MGLSPVPHSCEGVRAQVSLRLDAELSQLELRMLEAHLGRCADCREFEAAVGEFTTELRAAPLEPLARAVVIPRRRGFSVVGAQVAVAAVMALAVAGVASRMAVDELPSTSGSRSTAAATLFKTSWQPERELANLADAPKATDRSPGGPQTAI
jgi:predicted anti-sigma-YlaC factor YlaD